MWELEKSFQITHHPVSHQDILSLSCSQTHKAWQLPLSLGEWKGNQVVNVSEGDVLWVASLGEWRIPEATSSPRAVGFQPC